MKKLLSVLLLIFLLPLSACGGVKYEFKDGIMYEDGKEATGTFEFKIGKYKTKGNFVNGLAEGLFERYYPDGSVMLKSSFSNGKYLEDEIYYKNGKLMSSFLNDKGLNLFYDDGQLVMTFNFQTGESSTYHENGNSLMTINDKETAIYNENNEMLFKVKNGEPVDIGTTLKKLEDGAFEIVKDNKVVAKVDANGEIINYLYSTGETMLKVNETTGITEFFFKNGNTFMKQESNKRVVNYKDGKNII